MDSVRRMCRKRKEKVMVQKKAGNIRKVKT